MLNAVCTWCKTTLGSRSLLARSFSSASSLSTTASALSPFLRNKFTSTLPLLLLLSQFSLTSTTTTTTTQSGPTSSQTPVTSRTNSFPDFAHLFANNTATTTTTTATASTTTKSTLPAMSVAAAASATVSTTTITTTEVDPQVQFASSASATEESKQPQQPQVQVEPKNTAPSLQVVLRKSQDRGHGNPVHWLNSYHTFSFASYYDDEFDGFHTLRVINEDRVKEKNGFGMHGHRNFEIFSYVVSGQLAHRDSMGNYEVLSRGDVQYTTAGTGIRHEELNPSKTDQVHFLQIWVQPHTANLKPRYTTKNFSDQEKLNQWCEIVSSHTDNSNAILLNQDMRVYATLLENKNQLTLPVTPGHEYYVHVVDDIDGFWNSHRGTGVYVNDQLLISGDGAFIKRKNKKSATASHADDEQLTFIAANPDPNKRAEILVFDITVDK